MVKQVWPLNPAAFLPAKCIRNYLKGENAEKNAGTGHYGYRRHCSHCILLTLHAAKAPKQAKVGADLRPLDR